MLGSRFGNGNGNFAHLSKPHTQSIHHTRASAETDYPHPNLAAPEIIVVFGMVSAVIQHVPTHSKTNLLEAATAWMTRSKVSTVLAIAPLSTVAVSTSAEATVILGALDAGAPDVAGVNPLFGNAITKGPVFNSPAANGGASFGSTVNMIHESDSPVNQFTVTYAGSSSSGTLPAINPRRK